MHMGEPSNHSLKVSHQPRKVRSFVRRTGRLTRGQKQSLDYLFPKFGLAMDAPLPNNWQPGQVVVEIGFGMGDALHQLASAYPQFNFIGIDVHRPGIGHLLNRIESSGIKNLRLIEGDAMEWLNQTQWHQSLHAVLLWFPDPWPKKRHHKRRIVQTEFLQHLSEVLKPGGYWHFASDWIPYADAVKERIGRQHQLQLIPPEQIQTEVLRRPTTKFEQRGMALGHQITDLYCLKPTC